MMRFHRLFKSIITFLAMIALLNACSSFQMPSLPQINPWVAPYEREYLADPIMSFNKDPLSNRYRQHVFNTREGSKGAGYAHGGGCGCN